MQTKPARWDLLDEERQPALRAMPRPGLAVEAGRSGKVHRSDPSLIQAAQRGDQRAWDEIVELYGRLVYSIARRYGLSDADADDVFQSVFIILYRRLDSLRDQTRLSAWLITTAHRECWRVGRSTHLADDLDRRIADVSAPADEDAVAWEEQHLVHVALERLGGRCAELLRALFLERGEPDYAAIAARLGMRVGSIGPTRARCFRKLEKILLDLGFDPEAVPATAVTPG